MSDGHWTRIPLIGDAWGIVLMLPAEQLSEENWQHFLSCLDAMKPGLVAPAEAEKGEDSE